MSGAHQALDQPSRPLGRPTGTALGPSGRSPGAWEAVATGLGWFSLGLGGAQIVAPAQVNRVVGIDDTDTTRFLQRLVGARELTAAAGLLGPMRPAGWLWARVAGDALDVTLTASALRTGHGRRRRLAAVTVALAGVMVFDVVAARHNGRASRPTRMAPRRGVIQAHTAITVNKPVEEVYGLWRKFEDLPRFMAHLESVTVSDDRRSHWIARGPLGTNLEWDAEVTEDRPNELIAWRSLDRAAVTNRGSVRFAPAPGGRGSEVVVQLEYEPPTGAMGAAIAKLFGEEPQQQVKDDLRRFKQVLETGEVVRADGTPDGTSSQRQWHQRGGQPGA